VIGADYHERKGGGTAPSPHAAFRAE
jgi:hypothetical protein